MTHDKQAAAAPQVQPAAAARRRPRRVQWLVDEDLLRRLRSLAVRRGRTAGAELELAIQAHLQQHSG